MNLAIFTYSITYTSSAIWTHISVILKSQKIVLSFLVYKVKYRRSCPGCSMPLTEFFKKIARNFKLPLIGETQIEVSEKTSREGRVMFLIVFVFAHLQLLQNQQCCTAVLHTFAHFRPNDSIQSND